MKLTDWYGPAIQVLNENGYIAGTSSTGCSLKAEITRQETAVLMHHLLLRNDGVDTLVEHREITDYDTIYSVIMI